LENSGKRDAFDIQLMTPFANRIFTVPLYNDFVVNRWASQPITQCCTVRCKELAMDIMSIVTVMWCTLQPKQ